jgi:hypothetical protein
MQLLKGMGLQIDIHAIHDTRGIAHSLWDKLIS